MEENKLASAQPKSPEISELANLKVESPTQSAYLHSPDKDKYLRRKKNYSQVNLHSLS